MATKLKKVLLGYCAVDSGQLVIADPCYLRDWKDGEVEFKDGKVINAKDNHYAQACAATRKHGGEILVSGIGGTGVAFSSGYGDGSYPVYGFINHDGRVVKVEVDMGAGEEIFNSLMEH